MRFLSAQIGAIALAASSLLLPLKASAYLVAQGILGDRSDFFEQGDLQLQREIERLQQQPSTPALTVNPGLQTWQSLVSATGGFSVWMPAGIWAEETKSLQTPTETLTFHVFSIQVAASRFIVAYTESANSHPAGINATTQFTSVRDALVTQTQAEVKNSDSITLGNVPGQALQLQNSEKVMDVRMYATEDKLYVLAVVTPLDETRSQDAATFFNSFRLL